MTPGAHLVRIGSMRLVFAVLFALFAWMLGGCDCGGGPRRTACGSSTECPSGQHCVDRACVALPASDAAVDAAGRVDGALSCPSAILCGSPAACCEVGQECVEDACLAACASAVRCGADLTTCCASGEVCVSGACVPPGEACTDSFECEIGSFCEPTLMRCLPQFDPVTCQATPVFGMFETTLEWSVESATEAADCLHPISVPLVIDLDGDRIPEVISSMSCDSEWTDGVLRAFRGDTGAPVWSASAAELRVQGRASIAAGDLDGDGRPEIVAIQQATSRVLAFRPDGTLLWSSTNLDGTALFATGVSNGAPTIADLDQDGSPEIILGALVIGHDGRLEWTMDAAALEGTNSGYGGGISAVADLDGDGMPEVIAGRRAYHHDGTPMWTSAGADGYPAIAQFDADPQPEVVIVGSGEVRYLDGLTGVAEWGPIALPGGGIGGPPTIADFDGDGEPEIGVAGAMSYTVYDPTDSDGIVWSQATQDASSNTTGSSVFDFEGDGASEVVYADECYMRVYRGTDGMVLLQIPNTSATIHEYPVVADVDGDGNSEIVIVANDRTASLRTQCLAADTEWDGARRGLFVYGDARDQWMRTRRVWNQHTYHVTNVETSGVIPRVEVDNWTVPGLNDYRQNVQGEGVYNAPDLKVLGLEVMLSACPTSVRLRARVSNEGSLGVAAGVPVAFYRGTVADAAALIGVVSTAAALLPGASTVVEIDAPLVGDAPYSFLAVVDDDGTGAGVVQECDEDDNGGTIADVSCLF
jgi:hypothetical protein